MQGDRTPPSTASAPAKRPRALEYEDAGDRHVHRFHVETGSEPVMLSIGGPVGSPGQDAPTPDDSTKSAPAPVPGGFAKFFNRVIDTGTWARLPDAARAVYLPLVRVADGHQSFRARAGVAALMRQTGLSRSSVKRGIKALQEHRLIIVVRAGGVAADGTNRTNLYQLLVPEIDDEPTSPPARNQTSARAKRGSRTPRSPSPSENPPEQALATAPQAAAAPWFTLDSFGGNVTWTDELALRGVRERTPSPATMEPPRPSAADTPAVEGESPRGAQSPAGTGAGGEPLLRTSLSDTTSENSVDAVASAKRMLEEIGVVAAVAEDLARQHGNERIQLVVSEAARRQRNRRIRSAAGFAVKALAEEWEIESQRATGGSGSAGSLAERSARERAEEAESARAAQAQREADDAALDALSEQEWSALAQKVLDRFEGHPAMIRLLTRQAPQQCRLMRAEILGLLRS